MPLPYPAGWFAIAFAQEIGSGVVRPRRYFGRDLVVWRGRSGQLVIMDAHCPHLGAHLGHGGEVIGDHIRCPFHGLQFDARGACAVGIRGPNGPGRPSRATARTWTAVERDGIVLVWYHPDGEAPSFEVPAIDLAGFGPLHVHGWSHLRGHPQETTENSVDLAHFSTVHGYRDVQETAPIRTEGAHLYTRYGFTRPNPFLRWGRPVRLAIDVAVHGIGFSRVVAEMEETGIRTRHWVLPTPVDEDHVELRIAVAVDLRDRRGVSSALGLLPRRVSHALVGGLALRAYRTDVSQDFRIWHHKRYLDPPALAENDGPVGPYRRWVRQFYPG